MKKSFVLKAALALATFSISISGCTLFKGFGKKSDNQESQSNNKSETQPSGSGSQSETDSHSEKENTHTLTFNTNGGSYIEPQIVAHGEFARQPDDPTRPGYSFLNWTLNGDDDYVWKFDLYPIYRDIILNANWDQQEYTVTFVNSDGVILETHEHVHYGDSVGYQGSTPIAPNQKERYTYTFCGWDVDTSFITGNTVATAQYLEEYAPYTAIFLDEEGNILYSTIVREGETPEYKGTVIPTKENTSELQFQYDGWTLESIDGDIYTYRVHFESCTFGLEFVENKVDYYGGTFSEVIIPAKWNGYDITAIGQSAFQGNVSVTTVAIPNSVTSIYEYAFQNCTSLSYLFIPQSVTFIGWYALDNCSSLAIYTDCESIPESWTYYNSINIPVICGYKGESNLTINGYTYAFGEIGGERQAYLLSIDNTVTDFAISETINGARIVYLKQNLFSNNKNLKTAILPSSITVISDGLFRGCSSLVSVTIPDSIISIGCAAFECCSSLTSIKIPNSVKSIDNYAFNGCSSLTSIIIPDSVTSIGYYAFVECYSLKFAYIPKSVALIGDNAFAACTSITICCEAEYKPKNWESTWNFLKYYYVDDVQYKMYCPVIWGAQGINESNGLWYTCKQVDGEKQAFILSLNESVVDFVTPNYIGDAKVVSINANMFRNCKTIRTVTLPSYITEIVDSMFYGCTSLVSVSIPDGVTSIGYHAFESCSSLTSVTIPNSVTSIGYEAFYACSSLTSIIIPISVTTIGSYAFGSCYKLTIYCEAAGKPDGWESSWYGYSSAVVWGYTGS